MDYGKYCLFVTVHRIKTFVIHKFFIRTYQKSPIVQHYTYKTIKTNNYIHVHISYTHIDKRERYKTSTSIADIIDSINTYIVD